jgi:hypothetical protein
VEQAESGWPPSRKPCMPRPRSASTCRQANPFSAPGHARTRLLRVRAALDATPANGLTYLHTG